MMRSSRTMGSLLAVILALALGTSVLASTSVTIESAQREINLATQVVSITYKLKLRNSGKKPVESVQLCYPPAHAGHEAVIEFVQDRESGNSPTLKVEHLAEEQHGARCIEARLNTPINPGKASLLEGGVVLTQLQTPFPAAIFQNEPQRVLYEDNVFMLSPYKILKQTTKVKLPSKEVESYTKEQPTSLTGTTLKYGEYADVEPFTLQEMRLHFENNSPFSVATNLVREVEVSHWGNVYVEEHYTIQHKGAKIRGEWSRLELMRDPQNFGRSAVRAFIANLPIRAHSIYFKDAIGNISTSAVKHGVQSTELILTPRFPLYGGWEAQFTLGYSVPLQDGVFKDPATGNLRVMFLFGTPLFGLVVENIENKVVLPEGSRVVNVEGTFDVEMSRDKKFSYLDTIGRPVVVLRKKNLSYEHHQPFIVDYSFYTLSLFQEPLLLVGFFILLFTTLIAYNRCDFVISRGTEWESDQRAEHAAFLVQKIEAIIKEREKEVASASTGSAEEIQNLQERLRRSEEKLKARCAELEQAAGPQHSAKVRGLLEKERGLQQKISQIASTKGQLLQQGTDSQEAQAKAAADLKAASSDLRKAHTEKLQSIS